ncbi:hypothetical protein [Cryobacterium shii]|uniref:Uncharacterized protein n=1 Tax=Cryobacterium shii TaxID=1259235 RepID=A0AAQ2C5F5_9MICO|nr:hypothetical protein [Cryobacterium shii]TFC44873.1 hypothetical protein E3O49_11230 [Cryobacterium shii]
MKALRAIGGWFANYPLFVSTLIIGLVAGHYALSQKFPELNVAAALADAPVADPSDTLMSLALGVAGVSAMVGGFAGVVVVFGLGSENDRFRLLRRKGSHRLRANWISVVLSSLTGAFGAVISAVMIVGFGAEPGLWVLEACFLLTTHGAVRLTALLAGLTGIVDSQDEDAEQKANTIATKGLIPTNGRVPDAK